MKELESERGTVFVEKGQRQQLAQQQEKEGRGKIQANGSMGGGLRGGGESGPDYPEKLPRQTGKTLEQRNPKQEERRPPGSL